MNTQYAGIDYGMGTANRDKTNGIRFGVLPLHEVTQAWCDGSEPDYGDPTCPDCGGKLKDSGEVDEADKDYHCEHCNESLWSEQCFGEEALSFDYDKEGYKASQLGNNPDIFITRSPYFTYAQFCSPCASGACYLLNPLVAEEFTVTDNDVQNGNNIHPDTGEPLAAGKYVTQLPDGNRAYCFGHDWFDGGKAPYPVYSVETGELVEPASA